MFGFLKNLVFAVVAGFARPIAPPAVERAIVQPAAPAWDEVENPNYDWDWVARLLEPVHLNAEDRREHDASWAAFCARTEAQEIEWRRSRGRQTAHTT